MNRLLKILVCVLSAGIVMSAFTGCYYYDEYGNAVSVFDNTSVGVSVGPGGGVSVGMTFNDGIPYYGGNPYYTEAGVYSGNVIVYNFGGYYGPWYGPGWYRGRYWTVPPIRPPWRGYACPRPRPPSPPAPYWRSRSHSPYSIPGYRPPGMSRPTHHTPSSPGGRPSIGGRPSGSPSIGRPSSPSVGRPSSPSVGRPSSPSIGRPSSPSIGRPSSPSVGRPSSPSVGRPSSPSVGRPSTGRPSGGSAPSVRSPRAQPTPSVGGGGFSRGSSSGGSFSRGGRR